MKGTFLGLMMMAGGLAYGQTLPTTDGHAEAPKPVEPVKVIETQLTERDLLEYYKAQRDVENLLNALPIQMAQAKRDQVVGRLKAKCGDRGIVGDGITQEFSCGPVRPVPEVKK